MSILCAYYHQFKDQINQNANRPKKKSSPKKFVLALLVDEFFDKRSFTREHSSQNDSLKNFRHFFRSIDSRPRSTHADAVISHLHFPMQISCDMRIFFSLSSIRIYSYFFFTFLQSTETGFSRFVYIFFKTFLIRPTHRHTYTRKKERICIGTSINTNEIVRSNAIIVYRSRLRRAHD